MDAEHREDLDAVTIRPYVLTGGRVGQSSSDLPLETLVTVPFDVNTTSTTPEKGEILAVAAKQYISIAELSAHVKLPLGVIRVLICDLVDEGLISLHRPAFTGSSTSQSGYQHQSPSLTVLESVLDGISAL